MTTLPEEAVKAARKQLGFSPADDIRLRAALTAALPFLPVQGAVKKLEWFPLDLSNTLYAHSAFGMFTVWEIDGVGFFRKEGGYGGTKVDGNIEAAKAAAQADYSARILSALEPTAARELALEEAARVAEDYVQYDVAAAIRALSSQDHADGSKSTSDQKVCQTCNDRGIIGGMYRVGDGDVDAWEEPCPDCQKVKAHHSDADTGSDDLVQIAMHLDCDPDADSILHVIREIQADLDIAKHADAGKAEGDGWLPIESAPKDGTCVLVWKPDEPRVGEYICVAYWDDAIIKRTPQWVDVAGRGLGCLSKVDGKPQGYPTHWRPLPSAPSEGAK